MNIKISIGLTEFAVPAPRRGSIDVHSGLGLGPEVGQEIHLRVQAQMKLDSSNYQDEVSISHEIKHEEFRFDIRGRMDGLFMTDPPRIEEIKSTFNIYELLKTIKADVDHPYILQLKTYGYLYWLQNSVVPELTLHLISSRNNESVNYDIDLDLSLFEGWLNRRLDELVVDARADQKRVARRKKAARLIAFPFSQPRAGQIELIQTIEEGMAADRPMLLQAPTGLGKTIGVLYPTLKEALSRGQKVVYITPKNSQHQVAEEAIEKLQESAPSVKALTITAKSKMCFKNEAICNPDYCEFAKDHYTKVAENNIIEKLIKKRSLTTKVFKKIAREYAVCPFEIQLDAAKDADTVICDYNYVFAPRTAFGRIAQNGLTTQGKPNLVIDEAHNLPSRALDYYSPQLSAFQLEKMRDDALALPRKFRREFGELLQSCLQVLKSCGLPGEKKPHPIVLPYEIFARQDQELKSFLSTYLSSDVEIQSQDVVMRLSFYWSEFTNTLEFVKQRSKPDQDRFFTTYNPETNTVKMVCCDASEMLKNSYDHYAQVVAFSATLKPFEFYSQLAGLQKKSLLTAEFKSPFAKANRKIIVIPQISSKYSDRDRNYPKIAEAIEKISALKKGNYIAFFPSFDFMEKVLAHYSQQNESHILKQERRMRREDVDHFLEELKNSTDAHTVFAVQGGIFSEGVDYPGSMLIGAFVVGPPLPNFDLEREKMREYYEQHFAAGFDYAYTYPAMAKAVQAAGRVIRSETDHGIIVLMDNRFMQPSYVKSMPNDWYEVTPQEMVSQSILKDISDFWNHEKLV